MKKYLLSALLLLVSFIGFSQKGISYQAVILDPNKIEIPGQDITGQPFVNGNVWVKFTILSGNTTQFEEVQQTQTDAYGLVNLLIGSVSSASFNALVWDAPQKSLQVSVSFNQGATYTKVSDQKFSYNPYSLYAETSGKLGGTLGIAGGGTGATTAVSARANLGLGNVDNTADVDKPISTASQRALDLKANTFDVTISLSNKLDKVTGKELSTNDYTTAEKNKLAAITGTNTGDQDLSGYATTAQVATKANASDVSTSLAYKVDKVTGKELSTNDYTTAEKNKLAAITGTNTGDQDLSGYATTAQVATKANATDVNTALNLKANTSSLSTVATSGDYNDLSNKPTISSAYTLPTASASVLGGVKVGSNLNVDANGVLTANIMAGTLTGTTLAANVVNSSLTSVGTVTSGTFSLTTDITTSGTLKAGAVTYPNIHGTNGQVLTTTGSGTLSWTSIPSPDLTNYVTTNTAQTITSAKTFSETTTFSKDLAVNGITVGRGGGNESTNTAIGTAALTSNTTGNSNTAVGMNALSGNITGTYSTAIGLDALRRSTAGFNTAIGAFALDKTTTGVNNTAIGPLALEYNETGTLNTAIGYDAGVSSSNKGLTNTTAIGNGARVIASNTIQLGNASVTNVNTSGNLTVNGITVGKGGGNQGSNIAFGASALTSNTSGGSNTAIGHRTLSNNLGGGDNTAVGANALRFNTGDFSQLKGTYNTALGSSSLNANTEGSYNTATGANALLSNSTGNSNTAIGHDAGRYIFSMSLTDNTTSDYSVYLGSNTKASANDAQNEVVIGYNAIGAGNNSIQLGNNSVTLVKTSGIVNAGGFTTSGDIVARAIAASGIVTAGGNQLTSDLRLKSNIAPLANSLATVMQLNPVHYLKKGTLASTAYTREENGFIAQEIQKILPFVVTEGTDENKLLSVDYNSFIPVLTKAIQEQQKQIEDQNAKIAAQQKQIEELIKLVKGQ